MTTIYRNQHFTRIKNLPPKMLSVGRIKIGRLGEEIQSARGTRFQPPQKLDHFLITKEMRGPDGNFVIDDAAHAILGLEPTELPITFPFNRVEANFQSEYAFYAKDKLGMLRACHGDGEIAFRRRSRDEDEFQVECPCELLEQRRCKPNGMLRCVLDLPGIGGIGAVWTFRTTSHNTISAIYSSLEAISTITRGRLAGIPLKLVLTKQTAKIVQNGKQVTTTYPVVTVEFVGAVRDLIDQVRFLAPLETGAADQLRQIEDRAAESQPTEPDPEPEEVMEFYPEAFQDTSPEPTPEQPATLDDLPPAPDGDDLPSETASHGTKRKRVTYEYRGETFGRLTATMIDRIERDIEADPAAAAAAMNETLRAKFAEQIALRNDVANELHKRADIPIEDSPAAPSGDDWILPE